MLMSNIWIGSRSPMLGVRASGDNVDGRGRWEQCVWSGCGYAFSRTRACWEPTCTGFGKFAGASALCLRLKPFACLCS